VKNIPFLKFDDFGKNIHIEETTKNKNKKNRKKRR